MRDYYSHHSCHDRPRYDCGVKSKNVPSDNAGDAARFVSCAVWLSHCQLRWRWETIIFFGGPQGPGDDDDDDDDSQSVKQRKPSEGKHFKTGFHHKSTIHTHWVLFCLSITVPSERVNGRRKSEAFVESHPWWWGFSFKTKLGSVSMRARTRVGACESIQSCLVVANWLEADLVVNERRKAWRNLQRFDSDTLSWHQFWFGNDEWFKFKFCRISGSYSS